MSFRSVVSLALILLLSPPCGDAVAGATLRLDQETTLQLARDRAAGILAARARVGIADGKLTVAGTWRHNPEVELEMGPRSRPEGTTTDRFLTVSQRLDLAGRGARTDAARAAREVATWRLRDTELAVLAEAAAAHLVALHAAERRAVAEDALALAERVHDVAERRRAAGEVGALDTQVTTVAVATTRVNLLRAEADEQDGLAELARILMLEPDLALEIAGEVQWPAPPDLTTARAAVAQHPHLAALTARTVQTAAERRVAAAAAKPELELSAGFGREEEADLARFGVGVSLPVFNTGRGLRREAAAADTVAHVELTAARRQITGRLDAAWQRQQRLQEALETYVAEAVAAQAASVQLAEESYRTGKMDLGQLLAVQSALLDARRELTGLRLEAALASLEVYALAALPPLLSPPATVASATEGKTP